MHVGRKNIWGFSLSKNSVLMPALYNLKFITSRVQKGLSDVLSARIDSIPPGGLYTVSTFVELRRWCTVEFRCTFYLNFKRSTFRAPSYLYDRITTAMILLSIRIPLRPRRQLRMMYRGSIPSLALLVTAM